MEAAAAPAGSGPEPPGTAAQSYDLREIVNGMLYVLRGGIAWRALPHDFPPWESVYDHFRRWRENSTLEQIHDVPREESRQKQGRKKSPSAAVAGFLRA